jgi:hypothetical protein
MNLTPKAAAQAEALGVVVDVADVARRLAEQDPPVVDGNRTVRLGRPSRARIVVDAAGDVSAVLPSSPHAQAGVPDVRGGAADRKRARDQERWERRQAARAADPVAAPTTTPPSPTGRGGRRHGLSPEGESPIMQWRPGAEAAAALERLVARATARGERATASSVLRQLVLDADSGR